MAILAIMNHKGGVGKTTTAVNLAWALSQRKKTVLAIDFDPQGNLSQSFGITDPQETIYDAMQGKPFKPIEINGNLHLIAANTDFAAAEIELSGQPGREGFLKDNVIDAVGAEHYDYILIDCPPSLGLLTQNAIAACEQLLIPVSTDFLSLKGMKTLLENYQFFKKRINKNLGVAGILLTRTKNTNLSKEAEKTIREAYPESTFKTVIREGVALAEAPSHGKAIFGYDAMSNGALDYGSFCDEILARGI